MVLEKTLESPLDCKEIQPVNSKEKQCWIFIGRTYSEAEGFPDGSVGKEPTCNAEDSSLIPGLGRSPGEGKGNPLQSSGLENPMEKSMGSQRVGHYWVTFTSRHMCSVAQSCPTLWSPMDWGLQVPLPVGFSRQEYWSGLPFPSPGDLPDPDTELASLAASDLQVDSLLLSHQGSPKKYIS